MFPGLIVGEGMIPLNFYGDASPSCVTSIAVSYDYTDFILRGFGATLFLTGKFFIET